MSYDATLAYSDSGGLYACVVTDSNGSITTSNALLTVLFSATLFWISA